MPAAPGGGVGSGLRRAGRACLGQHPAQAKAWPFRNSAASSRCGNPKQAPAGGSATTMALNMALPWPEISIYTEAADPHRHDRAPRRCSPASRPILPFRGGG